MDQLLAKINKLTTNQVAYIFAVVGFAVYFIGLNNPFQGDDNYQIVTNVPVHSVKNILILFRSGTFYDGQHLTGIYYRPLMSAAYSFIYHYFGAYALPYHIVQLALFVSGAFILYLVFKHFFKTPLALLLALVFLAHPLNSQAAYSIPALQDVLFFFFGILAIWILIYRRSIWGLLGVAGCLLLSMFSKESGLVFIIIALLYLILFDRERLRMFLGIMVLPTIAYILLKINAVGLNGKQNLAPIDNLNFAGRILTAPSLVLFYLTKFIFPWKLATGYYWTYPTFSIQHVLLPLFVDLAIAGMAVYIGVRVHKKLPKRKFLAYLFFVVWATTGLALYLQIIPLDMTACETWFYFAMAGLLGMIGTALLTFKVRIQPFQLVLIAALLIGVLSVRSAVRGTDYHSQYILAKHDVAASQNDYSAMNNIAQGLIGEGKYKMAVAYAQHSVNIYPTVTNYTNLGAALQESGDYPTAIKAFKHALDYGSLSTTYEDLAQIYLEYGYNPADIQWLQEAARSYSQDYKLWIYLAILNDIQGDNTDAKIAMVNAAKYGPVQQALYYNIMHDLPFTLNFTLSSGAKKNIVVH